MKSRDTLKISAIILAGGRGSRLAGRDKGWIHYQGRPLISRVLERLQPQVDEIVISCNRNVWRYQKLGFPVVTDGNDRFAGPLAGIAAGVPHCRSDAVLLSPCDTPALPFDLVARLEAALLLADADVAIPRDDFGRQYLCSLLRREVALGSDEALQCGQRAVGGWLATFKVVEVDFAASGDGFRNINGPEDLADA